MQDFITAFRIFIIISDIIFGIVCFNGWSKEKDTTAKKGYMLFTFLLITSAFLIKF